jgi:hypothetical protein
VHERTNELLREAAGRTEDVDGVVRDAWAALAHLTREASVRTSSHALISTGAALAWASYESLTKDLWIAALNAQPTVLGAKVIAKAPADPGGDLSNKAIPVGLIAKYGFDLSRSMGSLLAPKYDFTSVSGIERAYRDAFAPAPIFTRLTRAELVELEAARHLIVHRAGIVDGEYQRRAKSTRPLGAPLDLDIPTIAPWINAVVETGVELVAFVDSRLTG